MSNSHKLKLSYFALLMFCTLSLIGFQNCSHIDYQSRSPDGVFVSSEFESECDGLARSKTLNALLLEKDFQFIVADLCGDIVYVGSGDEAPIHLSLKNQYQFYITGVQNFEVPTEDKWLGCVALDGAESGLETNSCVLQSPQWILDLEADCEGSESLIQSSGYQPLNCFPGWVRSTENDQLIMGNYDFLRSNDQELYKSGDLVYFYIKPNSPQAPETLRLVFTVDK